MNELQIVNLEQTDITTCNFAGLKEERNVFTRMFRMGT